MLEFPEDDHQPLNVVVAIVGEQDRSRIQQAIARRHVQVLDRGVSAPTCRRTVLALVGEGGQTLLFLSGHDPQVATADLTGLEDQLQSLLRHGRFHEGALLVLGRRRPKGLERAEAHYPNLLVELRQAEDPHLKGLLCDRGLAGLRGDAPSAVSGLLWWELGRSRTLEDPAKAVDAFSSAAYEFGTLRVTHRASRARRVVRDLERYRQLDFFRVPQQTDLPDIESANYEVIPAALAEERLVLATPLALVEQPSLAWGYAGSVQLDPTAIEQADLREAQLVVRSAAIETVGSNMHLLRVSMDLTTRSALGLTTPWGHDIRYSLNSSALEITPFTQFGLAGGEVVFRIAGEIRGETMLDLTASSEWGQVSHLRVALVSPRGGNGDIVGIRWPRAAAA